MPSVGALNQLAPYVERGIKPRRIDPVTRISLAVLSRLFFQLARRTGGRAPRDDDPLAPGGLEAVLAPEVSARPTADPEARTGSDPPHGSENPTWGEERIANELLLKLGIHVSPRTATFRLVYVFAIIEHGSRRLIHFNVTAHPTAAWTLQQLREAIGFEDRYQYVLHDRDSIFAAHLDGSVSRLGLEVLKSPPRDPKANAICERVIGTIRRECLDWLIAMPESHLRSILNSWIPHYHSARPHMALGPGVPDPPPAISDFGQSRSRHRREDSYAVRAKSVLGGLHHEYYLAPAAA